jgi:surface polysaccharide O-acyltransferase-like enzyme
MCGYLIVVKIFAKIRLSYKYYRDGQRMNMYMLTIYIIHSPFDGVMLSHDLQLDVRCDFNYGIKAILIINVGCNCFIVVNWDIFSNDGKNYNID